jgi:hypothetical protein
VGHQEVRPFRRRQGVLVGLPEHRHHDLTDDNLAALAPVHDAAHQVRVDASVGVVRPHGPEAEAQRLDLLPVVAAGGDDGLVAPCLEAEGDGDVGVQVA